ncbi:unnamed protein product [Lymnaea stagnalis]|uniref:Uncharacterized protein n=1 Tax=Lymnaea stagnalis TaxID=6523 RepID=A0AAV2HML7_LYMST
MFDTRFACPGHVCLALILYLAPSLGELYCPPAIPGEDYVATAELSYESLHGCLPLTFTLKSTSSGTIVTCDLSNNKCTWEGKYHLDSVISFETTLLGNGNGFQITANVPSANFSMFLGQTLHLEWGLCDGESTSDSCSLEIGGPTDECALVKPCLHTSDCIDEKVGYDCRCASGYSGLNCSVGDDELACNVTSITLQPSQPEDACFEDSYIQCWVAAQSSYAPVNLSVDYDKAYEKGYDVSVEVTYDILTLRVCLTQDSAPGSYNLTYNISTDGRDQEFPVTLSGEILPYSNTAPKFVSADDSGSYLINVTESVTIGAKVLCVNRSRTERAGCLGQPSCVMVVDPDDNKNFGVQSLGVGVIDYGTDSDVLNFTTENTEKSLGCLYVQKKLIPAKTFWIDLTVQDGGMEAAKARFYFYILDANEPPMCEANSIELGALSAFTDSQDLVAINCTDPDTEDEFRQIKFAVTKYADIFRVSSSGVLQVYSPFKTWEAGYYSFNITATGYSSQEDARFTSVITVTFAITIPGPNCSLSSANPWPMSWRPNFTEINLTLSCDTRDVGRLLINSVDIVEYYSTFEANIFSVTFQTKNQSSATVTLKLVTYEAGYYIATVNATLGGEWSVTTMRIPVFNPPSITTPDDIVRILSTVSVGSEILTIRATSDTEGSSLTYSIIDGNSQDVFSINATEGTVYLMKDILTDADIIYRLTFEVKDSASNLTSEKVVEIQIIPVLESAECVVLRSNVSVYRSDDINTVGYVVCRLPHSDSADYSYSTGYSWGLSVSDRGVLYVSGSPTNSVYSWDAEVIVSDNVNMREITIKFKYYIDFNCDDSLDFCITLNAGYCSDSSVCTNCSNGWSGINCSTDENECTDFGGSCLTYDLCENTAGSYRCLGTTTSSSSSQSTTTTPPTTTTSSTTTSPTSTTTGAQLNCTLPPDKDIYSNEIVGYIIAKIECKDQADYSPLNFSVLSEPPPIKVNIAGDGTITLASGIPETMSEFDVIVTVNSMAKKYSLKCTIVSVCPQSQMEGLTFERTNASESVSIRCPSGYNGTVTRRCDGRNKWGDFNLNDCERQDLKKAVLLVDRLQDKTISREQVTELVDQVSHEMNSSFQNSTTIVSGDIKLVVNLFSDMSKVINQKNASVSPEILTNLAFVCDKLVSADSSVWSQLDKDNPAAGILESMETFTRASLNSWKDTKPIEMSNIVISCLSSPGDIQFPQKDFNAGNSSWAFSNEIFLEKSDMPGNVNFSVLVYKNLAQYVKINATLQNIYEEDKALLNKSMNSQIVSFSMENKDIKKPVQLTFKLTLDNYSNPSCGFLKTDLSESDDNVWSTKGCRFLRSNKTHVVCSCNHTTNFAVLMSAFASPDDSLALSIISAVGCAISLFCLVMTIIVYSVVWKYVKNDRSVLHVNLSVCLIIGYVVFLAGVNRTDNEIGCKVVAALLHFFFLVVFFTMLAEGIEILKSVSFVFTSKSILRYLLLVAYGAPLIIVAVSLGVKQTEGYGTKDFCWLSVDDGLIWAFVGPVLFVFLVNFIILIIVLKTMQTSQIMRDKSAKDRIKSVVRSISILSPILGLAWIFGVLSVNEDTVVFQYLFAIFNSLQGLFVFIFQCLLQHQVKDGFKAMRRKHYAKSMDSGQRVVSGSSQSKGVSYSYSQSASQSKNVTQSTYAQTSPIKEQQFTFHQYNNPAFQDNTDGKKSVKSNKSYTDNISHNNYEEDDRIVPVSNDREDVYFYMGRTLYRDSRKEVAGESNMDSFSFPSPKLLDRGNSQEPIIYGRPGIPDEAEDEHSEQKSLGLNIIDKWRAVSRRRSSGRDENPEIEKERLRHVYGDVGTINSREYRDDGHPSQIRAREHWRKVQDFAKSPVQNYPAETLQTRNENLPSSPFHGPVNGYRQAGNVKSRPNLTPLIIPRPSRISKPAAQNYHSKI